VSDRIFTLLLAGLVHLGCSSDDTTASCNTEGYCCCSGDVLDPVTCGSSGPKCDRGTLYKGDDCRCLPDRNTPCCVPHGVADTGTGRACGDACCCQGDVVDLVQCTDAGPMCKAGYSVYYGTDCDCLPDRNTPCCAPH
jgi:hypothetical protein